MDASVVGDMGLDRLEEIPMTPAGCGLVPVPATPGHAATSGVYGHARPPHLDDGQLTPGDVGPEEWTLALACWKARAVAESLGPKVPGGGLGRRHRVHPPR